MSFARAKAQIRKCVSVTTRSPFVEEVVEVRCKGQTWCINRRQLRRFEKSFPGRVFGDASQLVGSEHIALSQNGTWIWKVHVDNREALGIILRYLQTGFIRNRDLEALGVAELASEWGIPIYNGSGHTRDGTTVPVFPGVSLVTDPT
jgi:hypothetical protein